MRFLKTLFLGFALLGLVCLRASEVKFDGGNVTFEAPDDFTPLSQDEIAANYPKRMGPLQAVGNDLRDVCISYAIADTRMRPEQLSELKTVLADSMQQLVPGMQLIKNDFMDINGTRWIILESVITTGDRKVHNLEIATPYRQHLLFLNFTANPDAFTTYGNQLWKSLKTVKILSPNGGDPVLLGGAAPQSAADFVSRGAMELGFGDLDEAEAAFRAAISANPEMADAKIGLGRINADRELYHQAITNYSEAIADNRQSHEAYCWRGLAKAELGLFDDGLGDIEKARSLKPDQADYLCAYAYVEMSQGDFDSASTDYHEAFGISPNNHLAHLGLGRLHLFRGEYDAALLDFQTASLRGQSDPLTFNDLALLSILTGKPDIALREFQNIPDLTHDPDVVGWTRLQMWAVQAEQGQVDAANRDLSTYLQGNNAPSSGLAKILGEYLLGQTGESDVLAATNTDNPYRTKAEQCRAYYFIGIKRHIDQDEPGSLNAFRQCLATGLKSRDEYLLARARLPKDEVESAENGIKEALPILEGLGRRYYSVGFWIVAIGTFTGLVVIGVVIVFYSQSKPRPRLQPEIKRAPRLK